MTASITQNMPLLVVILSELLCEKRACFGLGIICPFKGTGTRDLIWLKVVVIGNILISRAHGRPLQFLKVFLYIFNYYFKKLVVLAKIVSIANVNRIVCVN